MLEQYKEIWYAVTLVDITETGVLRGKSKGRNQQRNFETLQQCVSMLSQPWGLSTPSLKSFSTIHSRFKDIGVQFGTKHDFTQEMLTDLNIWTWRFGIESIGVFGEKGYATKLEETLQNIPVITNLDENCILEPPVFSFTVEDRNMLLIQENLK